MNDVQRQRWTAWAERKFGRDRAKMAAALEAVSESHRRGESGASAAKRAEAAAAAVGRSGRGGEGAWGSAASAPPPQDAVGGHGAWTARPPGKWSMGPDLRGAAPARTRQPGGRKGVRTAAYAGLCLGALLLLVGSPAGLLLLLAAAAALFFARSR